MDLAIVFLRAGGDEDERRAGEIGKRRRLAAPVAIGGDQRRAGLAVQRGGEVDDLRFGFLQ
jgi:hypothetical protein